MPTVQFGGLTDPDEHLATYESHMFMYDPDDAVWCKVFPTTITGLTQSWFRGLSTGSIGSYKDLSKRFTEQYAGNRRREKSSAELFTLCQKPGERLREFLKRFDLESQQVKDLNATMAVFALTHGLADGSLKSSLIRNPPDSMYDVRASADGYIREEEYRRTFETKKEGTRPTQETRRPRSEEREKRERGGSHRGGHRESELRQRRNTFNNYTPLNRPRAEIFELTKDINNYRKPISLNSHGDKSNYCEYHRSSGHGTEDCFNLKNEIETLIRKGRLNQYTGGKRRNEHSSEKERSPAKKRIGEVMMIDG
ncbi:hypothetical protein RND81_09G036000 [Saponaria officinalis]